MLHVEFKVFKTCYILNLRFSRHATCSMTFYQLMITRAWCKTIVTTSFRSYNSFAPSPRDAVFWSTMCVWYFSWFRSHRSSPWICSSPASPMPSSETPTILCTNSPLNETSHLQTDQNTQIQSDIYSTANHPTYSYCCKRYCIVLSWLVLPTQWLRHLKYVVWLCSTWCF